jgi:hypothetical protein
MTAAIFGKYNMPFKFCNPPGFSYVYAVLTHRRLLSNFLTGSRSASLGQDMLLKVKAVYSLTEQLYSGTLRSLVALGGNRKPPSQIKAVLDHLSTFPSQIEEQKLSAARAGAIIALGRAKAWQSELDPEEIATGCPEFKDDQSLFEEKDFNQCVREMRPVACKLIEELNLKNIRRLTMTTIRRLSRQLMMLSISLLLSVSISSPLTLIILLYSMMRPLSKL